jgi:hypothetical protein
MLTATKQQIAILKATVLVILTMGALSQFFRTDEASKYVCVVCVSALAILAGRFLFKR